MFIFVGDDDVLCFDQVETMQQYFPVFDKLRKEFFVGELIWNFADFMTKQREILLLLINYIRPRSSVELHMGRPKLSELSS